MQANLDLLPPPAPGKAQLTSQGHPRTVFKRALEHDNLVLAEVTAREIGRVTVGSQLSSNPCLGLVGDAAGGHRRRDNELPAHDLCANR